MLDVGPAPEVAPESAPVAWEAIPSRAETPRDLEGFFNRTGPTKPSLNEQRSHHRFYLRQPIVLKSGGDLHAGYACDVSRSGMGLVSPVQLFPLDEVRVWLPGRKSIDLRIVRCVRSDDRCYVCGATFIAGGA